MEKIPFHFNIKFTNTFKFTNTNTFPTSVYRKKKNCLWKLCYRTFTYFGTTNTTDQINHCFENIIMRNMFKFRTCVHNVANGKAIKRRKGGKQLWNDNERSGHRQNGIQTEACLCTNRFKCLLYYFCFGRIDNSTRFCYFFYRCVNARKEPNVVYWLV